MSGNPDQTSKQPLWFLLLFAAATAGGSIAYIPFLTVLLPLKVTSMMGSDDVGALAEVTFYGAVIASVTNIAFGMLSDRSGSRIPWIVAGMLASGIALISIGFASSLSELLVLVMIWQIGLNMMLGPLFAWAGDCIPDSQKGLLGGLLAFAPAMGALAGSAVTLDGFTDPQMRLVVVAGLVALMVTPVLVFGRGREQAPLMQPVHDNDENGKQRPQESGVVIKMWIARFLVQISEAGLFAFQLFWLRSLVSDFHENSVANIFSAILLISVPLALALGRWSDKQNRPILPLAACALLSSGGLVIMAMADELNLAIVGYVVFGIAATIFLSLHTGQTLRVLPKPQHRGRDLGVFNLTNTVPSLVMPWLTLSLVPGFGFSALFTLFAALSILAGLLLATVASPR